MNPPRIVPLAPEGNGYFSGLAGDASAGARYRYRLDGADGASRSRIAFSARGPPRTFRVIDRVLFRGRTSAGAASPAKGRSSTRCTSAPSRRRARGRRPPRSCRSWRALGITVIEMMPVADFPARFGWGYDGVNLFAPTRLYGTPDDLRALCRLGACAGHRRDPRRGLQPPRPGRNTTCGEFARDYFTDRYEKRMGRGDQLRRPEHPVPCASSSLERRVTGSTSSISTGCGSMRRSRSMSSPIT